MENLRDERENETGIGGWLILVLLGLIITPIRLGVSVFMEFLPLFDSLPMLEELYPELKSMIYLELFGNISFGIFAIILIFLMIKKDRRFPLLMIIFYVSNLVFIVFDAIYVSQMVSLEGSSDVDDSSKEIIRSVIGTAIWVPYMLVSKRVKRTFTN